MTTAAAVDAARLCLALGDLRLPAIKLIWPDVAARADKEGWPAARFLAALAEHGVQGASEQKMQFSFDGLSPPEISDLQRLPHPTGIIRRYGLPLSEACSAVLHTL